MSDLCLSLLIFCKVDFGWGKEAVCRRIQLKHPLFASIIIQHWKSDAYAGLPPVHLITKYAHRCTYEFFEGDEDEESDESQDAEEGVAAENEFKSEIVDTAMETDIRKEHDTDNMNGSE